MNKLEEARIEIEDIDIKMIELFEKRMNSTKKVIEYKKENNLPILDLNREKILIEKNLNKVSDELKKYYEEYIKKVIEISKEYQKDLLDE